MKVRKERHRLLLSSKAARCSGRISDALIRPSRCLPCRGFICRQTAALFFFFSSFQQLRVFSFTCGRSRGERRGVGGHSEKLPTLFKVAPFVPRSSDFGVTVAPGRRRRCTPSLHLRLTEEEVGVIWVKQMKKSFYPAEEKKKTTTTKPRVRVTNAE